jgi:low affinity Fe/Cu permease
MDTTNPHESARAREREKRRAAERDTRREALSRRLESFAGRVTASVGRSAAFALACALVVVWLATGPFFHYSDTWQLVINTGTTIVTFLMVFLIQRAQNKESRAIQLKLNELIAAVQGASNHLIGAEALSERELEVLTTHYRALLERIKDDHDITESHSVDEAGRRHAQKRPRSLRPAAARSR